MKQYLDIIARALATHEETNLFDEDRKQELAELHDAWREIHTYVSQKYSHRADALADAFDPYIRAKHNQDQCMGFIAGFEKCYDSVKGREAFVLKDIHDDVVEVYLYPLGVSYEEANRKVSNLYERLNDARMENDEGYDWLEEQFDKGLKEIGFTVAGTVFQYTEED